MKKKIHKSSKARIYAMQYDKKLRTPLCKTYFLPITVLWKNVTCKNCLKMRKK